MTTDQFIQAVTAKVLELYAGFSDSPWSFSKFVKLVKGVVRTVEGIAADFGNVTGAQKKEAAVKVLNGFIDIPYLNESMEAILISSLVEAAVAFFNSKFGQAWVDATQPSGQPHPA